MSFYCHNCDKFYKSSKSLHTHNKTYHNESNDNVCEHCQNLYSTKYTLLRHLVTCKEKKKQTYSEMKAQLMTNYNPKLVNEFLKDNIKTEIQQINSGIIGNNNNNNNNMIHSNNKTQNIQLTINFGSEDLMKAFTDKEQIKILNKRYKCLDYLVEYTHFNEKYPQFQNMYIDDLKSNRAFVYDKKKKDFKVVNKSEMLDDLIYNRINDINDFYQKNSENIKNTTKQIVTKYISKIEEEFEKDNSKYMKQKKNDLSLSIYNESDIVKDKAKKIKKLKST